MDRIDELRAFAAAAQAGGFAEAGRRLGLSRSRISKLVMALEARLGSQVLIRSNRALSLTDAGRDYLSHAVEILDRIDAADGEIAGRLREPRGRVRINAPIAYGRSRLAAAVARFLAAHPGIAAELELDDRFVDPVAGGFDVTIRIGTDRDSSLIGRRIGVAATIACAAPAYLAAHPAPADPSDLARHACLQYRNLAPGSTWRFRRDGETRRVATSGRLSSNNGEALCAAAIAGAGIALLPDFIVADPLRAGALVPVLPGWSGPELSIHALYPRTRRLSRASRALMDALARAAQA
jgi:DNA-binding transcriptional LysR family regulator